MPGHYGYDPIRAMDNSIDGGTGLPSTHSSQQLMNSDTDSVNMPERAHNGNRQYDGIRSIATKDWFTVAILCFVNLINYMDRFTIAGVLPDIQSEFKLPDDSAGLLQTVFVLSYMICAPIFGYLGDRHSRKLLMAAGVFIWSATTLLGSFMQSYGWFITFRALVGFGEASYSTIAPTIISDLFVHNLRSKMLAVFYFAIPVGSGLGYIVGSETAHFAGSWRWALRVTPLLGVVAVILLLLIKEPERGQSEGTGNLEVTSFKDDLKDLMKNRSFMLSTAGFTCVTFVTGALAFWGPKFIFLGLRSQPGNENLELTDVSFKFGAIAMVSGVIGVPLGSGLSQSLVKRYPTADPLLCASGILLGVPLLAAAMIVVSENALATYVLIFFGELALNINWAIVADMLLYVVIPTRRSTAEAIQILISHAFGDAGSPYLVGVMSEAIKPLIRLSTPSPSSLAEDPLQSLSLTLNNATNLNLDVTPHFEDTNHVQFQALQYALFSTSFVEVLGGVFFLLTAIYIIRDKNRASEAVRDYQQEMSDDSTVSVSSIDLTLLHTHNIPPKTIF